MATAPGPDNHRINAAFLRCTGRHPAPDELLRLLRLLHEERSSAQANQQPETGWLAVARVLLNLDETITRE
jgi:hypothetical protein